MRELQSLSITSQANNDEKKKERHARCSCCFDVVVFYQPKFWNRDRLDFILTKWFLGGFGEQALAVIPLSLYMILFQYWALGGTIPGFPVVVIGLILCIVGLFVFLEGLHHGLMQLSYAVGRYLRAKSSWVFNLFVALVIGTGVTMAEPAIIALQAIGAILSIEATPFLYYIINDLPLVLSLTIGLGVGAAVVIGFCKMRYNWQLRPLILYTLLPTALMATGMALHPDLSYLVGFAWDCGAITTGEVTVPVVVALGSGISATECVDNPYAGLGIVTIGSILPITTVQFLCIFVWLFKPVESITPKVVEVHDSWTHAPGVHELKETLQITIPLILFLFWILIKVLKEKIPQVGLSKVFEHDKDYEYRMEVLKGNETSILNKVNFLWAGLFCTVVGLYIFNVGLTKGLSALGFSVGSTVPKLFVSKEDEGGWGPSLYSYEVGVQIMLAFAFLLGYGATVAEPALEILGSEVESLSKKRFTKRMLIHSISFGVGFGSLLGLARIAFHHQIIYYIIPLYWLAIVLTYFSTEAILHIAWDASAVTTGPVTVPLILGVGIATATEVRASEGFGILALASLCPILSTLTLGLLIRVPWIENIVYKGEIYNEEAEIEMEHMLAKSQDVPTYGTMPEVQQDTKIVGLDVSSSVQDKKEEEESKYRGVGEVFVI